MRRKPDIKYTDMCIYIDNHVYEDEHDAYKIFEYLQMLVYALAVKKRFFNSEKDYDDYSLYVATKVYLRLTNKRQFLNEDDANKLPKVKSVLNFVKSIMYPLKVNFLVENYNAKHLDFSDISTSNDYLSLSTIKNNDTIFDVEIDNYMQSLPKIIYKFLNKTEFKNDLTVKHNLYISVLLTFLNMLTLNNDTLNKGADYLYILESYYNEANSNAVLWHLPEYFRDYIYVISKQIFSNIIKDINYLRRIYVTPENVLQKILIDQFLNEENNNE